MASGIPTPEQSAGALSPTAQKPQRVLACVLCQQRKVKCDRKFPCANCIKSGAQCLSAGLAPRQRRRRFPERELLNRLRHYEHLLTEHNIPFEPLHTPISSKSSNIASDKSSACPADETIVDNASSRKVTSVHEYHTKNFWHAMNRKSQVTSNDETDESQEEAEDGSPSPYVLRQLEIRKVWDQLYDSSDHLLFCSRNTAIDLSVIHPTQVHIFKLWQIYLDNINPLLKVTHTPTLQPRILDAASDLTKIDPPLEALMFSIYCVSVFSLGMDECQSIFGTSRQDMLKNYQMGAREALLNCRFLRTNDRDCLTALHLYLISIKPNTDPRSLSSMLGVALRIAQRMGIHCEAANSKRTVLEAEMRRRLWWSLILFDARISEMTEFKVGMLLPTWDCLTPLNVNDFDLRPEMKNRPAIFGQSSEALFVVVRSEFGEFTRHSSFHLDFVNPALKPVARGASSSPVCEAKEITALENMFENKYLSNCESENPLHFMTIWTARGSVAKCRFVEHLSNCLRSAEQPTDQQRHAGFDYALTMLECDTNLMNSKLIKGFRWLIYPNFPFPAYVHLVQELKKRPLGTHADKAWKTMSENCSARFKDIENRLPMDRKDNPFFKIFTKVILQAWEAREIALEEMGQPAVLPPIVSEIKQRMTQLDADSSSATGSLQNMDPYACGINLLTPDTLDFSTLGPFYDTGGRDLVDIHPGPLPATHSQTPVAYNNNQWDWPAANWNLMLGHGW